MSRPLPSFSEAFGSPEVPQLLNNEDNDISDDNSLSSCSSSSSDAERLEDAVTISDGNTHKRKRLRSLDKTAQQLLMNVHKYFTDEKRKGEDLVHREKVLERTAAAAGLSRQTVSKYVSSGKLKDTPDKKRVKRDVVTKMDSFSLTILRDTVYSFYRESKCPTAEEILVRYKHRTSTDAQPFKFGVKVLINALKKIGFKYKLNSANRLILMEKYKIQCWRYNYLMKIGEARKQLRNIVFLDETWFNAGESVRRIWTDGMSGSCGRNPIGKGERLLVVAAGSDSGWVLNSFFAMRTKKGGSVDYHRDMDSHNFEKWFTEKLIPHLLPRSLIVMDNARYHCRRSERLPTIRDTKRNIVEWLDERSISHPDPATTLKIALIDMCKKGFTLMMLHPSMDMKFFVFLHITVNNYSIPSSAFGHLEAAYAKK